MWWQKGVRYLLHATGHPTFMCRDRTLLLKDRAVKDSSPSGLKIGGQWSPGGTYSQRVLCALIHADPPLQFINMSELVGDMLREEDRAVIRAPVQAALPYQLPCTASGTHYLYPPVDSTMS